MSEIEPPVSSNPLPPKTSALAVWSLVLGILSLVCLSIFAAIPGVICGHKALTRIKFSGGALEGRGLAIGGLVTGYLAILFLPLMMAIAIPNYVKARQTAQMNVCMNNLRLIDDAKRQWAQQNNKQATDTPTMEDLRPYLVLAPNGAFPVCPAGGHYTINAVGEKPTCSIPEHKLP